MWRILFIQFIRKPSDFLNGSGHTEPGICLRGGSIVLSVHPKVGIVLTLDQPVVSFVAISSPRLYREGLVLVIVMSRLLV
jgi:hypothetical protein